MRRITIITLAAAILLFGCGRKEDGITKTVGKAIGRQATEFTEGMGKGFDQAMLVQAALSPQAQAIGLTNTIAKTMGMGSTNTILVYLVASESVSNTLVARALNAGGAEIGRAKTPIVMEKDDAKYIAFTFGDQMDAGMVKVYRIGL